MSNSGSLGAPNGQDAALARGRTAAHLHSGGDRTAAIYLGMVRIAFDEATNQLEGGIEPAVIVGELMVRLGAVLECGNRELDEVVRNAGYRLAERRIEADHIRRRGGQR